MSAKLYKSLQDSYLSTVKGKPPKLMVCGGKFILWQRPDLEGQIDPHKAYYITKDSITEVEND